MFFHFHLNLHFPSEVMKEPEYIAGVVTKLAYSRFKFQWGKKILLFSMTSRPALDPPTLMFSKYQCSFPGKKWPEHEVDQSPPVPELRVSGLPNLLCKYALLVRSWALTFYYITKYNSLSSGSCVQVIYTGLHLKWVLSIRTIMTAAISESGKARKTEKYGITGHIYRNK